ncbi:hypothetical protein N7536_005884 [Penicillium majusculum]|nr:hypothetical protein N7536_005884 [Penicillium majusculum]
MVLAGIWAVILHKFTASEHVKFAVILESEQHQSAEVCSITLQPGQRFQELTQKTSWDAAALVDEDKSLNTALKIIDGPHNKRANKTTSNYRKKQRRPDIALILAYNTVALEIDPTYVDTTFAQAIAGAIEEGLLGVAGMPEVLIADIRLVDPVQNKQIALWQESPVAVPEPVFLFGHVSLQAQQRPTAMALDAFDRQWTYGDLDYASSALAAQLQAMGVGRGVFVPTCFNKTSWAVVAMLAVNRAGGAFVPCDPSQPAERRQDMMHRIHATVVLTSKDQAHLFADFPRAITMVISPDTVDLSRLARTASRAAPIDPESPAYVLFTSGSTGVPKACEISHAAFASISNHTGALHMSHNTRALQFASFTFGMAIIEVFCTLAAGGTICMLSDEQRLNSLAATMTALRINWVLTTPTVLGSLQPRDLPYVRHLIVAGEALRESQLRTWMSSAAVFQALGLTEWTGIFAVSEQLTAAVGAQSRNIGKPVNGWAWLVDADNYNMLTPLGAPGELVIAGPAVSRGYLQDPTRTAASFFNSTSWSRKCLGLPSKTPMYRTGDILRYNADGSMEYCGRKDNQVKIRGMRVELGEVESNLLKQLPEATSAVAIVLHPPGSPDGQILTAFVTLPISSSARPLDGGSNDTKSLLQFLELDPKYQQAVTFSKQRLRDRLPDYMVPQYLLPVAALPVTITRKVDRKKLADAANQLTVEEIKYLAGSRQGKHRAPSTASEQLVYEMVRSVLGISSPGMQDNFFDLAGDSVTAIKMVGLARRRGMKLTVGEIFERPILGDLAAGIAQAQTSATVAPKMVPFSLLNLESRSQTVEEVAHQTQIDPGQVVDAYPCTSLQEGLCALSARDPTSYKARIICELQEGTDLKAFGNAWERVFQSNDILRTRLVASSSHGTIQAVVREEFEWDSTQNLQAYIASADQEPMGIGKRLVRACLFTQVAHPTRFIVTMHHSICDRWSLRLLLEQLEAIVCTEKGLTHQPFRPFIEHLLQSQSSGKEYWANQFKGLEAVVFPHLPTLGYTPVVDGTEHMQLKLPGRASRNLGTMSTYVRLAWALTLAHNTCMNEVLFGCTVTGRGADLAGIDELAGPTISTVPVRLRLDMNGTAADALTMVQKHFTDMVPFEQTGLQNIQQYSPDTKSATQFQNHLGIMPAWTKPLDLFPKYQEGASVTGGFASYPLCLECYLNEDDTQIDVVTYFDSNVIEAKRVQRLISHMEYVLSVILEQPYITLSSLSQISPCDLASLNAWNANLPPRPRQTIHGIIEQHAKKNPSRPAIDAPDGQLTYSQLNGYSTVLATELIRRGVQQGSLIPLYFMKDCWTFVAMLAALKIGAGIVQLDPSHPLDRIQSIYRQTECQVILCTRSFAETVEKIGAQPIIVEANMHLWSQLPNNSGLPRVNPMDVAYMIFTSGSTGEPKGLTVHHSGLIASASAYAPDCRLDERTRMLHFAAVSFDGSYIEIFGTLLAGGCLCIPTNVERMNDIHAAISRMRVTHSLFTPSYARLVEPKRAPSLKVTILGGEAVLESDVAQWIGHVDLVNIYGPAECTPATATQYYDVTAKVKIAPEDIGHPRGCMLWICDPQDPDKLLPLGAVGELLIEGPAVGGGYHKDAVRTAAAFIDPPRWLQSFRGARASRIYRSGDLAHYTEDGRLRYCGRMGRQFKLRGQRIDPAHVEQCLLQDFDSASEVVAVIGTTKGAEGRPALIAFVLTNDPDGKRTSPDVPTCIVPSESFRRQAQAARERLQHKLPEYMVPSVMIAVSAMPRTTSNKLDRKALTQEISSRTFPELMQYGTTGHGGSEAVGQIDLPSTDAERELQAIWARVLRLPMETIGVNQSFFEFGGDSITSMLVVAQIRTSPLGLALTVDDIFRLKTIAQLAIQAQAKNAKATLQLEPEAFGELFALSPIQQLFFDTNPEGQSQFSHNLLLNVKQSIGFDQLQAATDRLVQVHSMLRARFQRGQDGQWKQLLLREVKGSFRSSSHRLADAGLLQAVIESTQRSLDITTGPIFSVDLIEIDGQQAIFLLAHYLVIDQVSWTVLLSDLEELLSGGSIKEPPVSFQQWSHLLVNRGISTLEPPDIEDRETNARAFWGVSEKNHTFGDAHDIMIKINPSTTGAILGGANQAFGTQPAELIHAALLFAFSQTFPDRSLPTVFLEAHGREPWDTTIDITRTVGLFTTLSPVPINPGADRELSSIVLRSKDSRRKLRLNGSDDFTARYYNISKEQGSGTHDMMEIVLNYAGQYEHQLGQTSSLFEIESLQNQHIYNASDKLHRWSLIDINALVGTDGSLGLVFTVPRKCSRAELLDPWFSSIRQTFEKMATEFVQSARVYTLADFGSLELDYSQLELLLSALAEKGVAVEDIEDTYPCAPIQRGILLSQAKNPAYYHVAMTWQLTSGDPLTVAVQKAQTAVEKVIERHASLRTIFIRSSSDGGVYDQVVLSKDYQEVAVKYSDVNGFTNEFQLSPERPSQFEIHVAADRSLYIHLDITHALADAMSMALIQNDLRLAYDGNISALNAAPYSRYLSYLQGQDDEAAGRFWGNRLKDVHPCLFPTLADHSGQEEDANKDHILEVENMDLINAYCKTHNVTPATIFSTAWALVLRSFTGSDDVCFGILTSGRELPFDGADEVVGPLINILTMALDLSDTGTAGDLIQKVHADCIESRQYQTYPLSEILHRKKMTDTSLFDTAVSIQRVLEPTDCDSSTRLELVRSHDLVEYAIVLNIDIEETRSVVHLRHWLSSVSEAHAELIASSFGMAVRQIVASDHVLATKVDLMGPEQHSLLQRWNGRVPPAPTAAQCVHDYFQEHAEETPEKQAVCTSDGNLSYRELDRLSDSLAYHLVQHGIRPRQFIPICMEKSRWTVVALMGAMKAGAAFALLDATHPDQRLRGLCEDIGSPIILASEQQAQRCLDFAKSVITVGADDVRSFNPSPSTIWRPHITPENELCVVFTSGSSGKPKGAILDHGSFCVFAAAGDTVWRITPETRFMQFASYAFDVGLMEMLLPLMRGGTTCILSEVERRDRLAETMTSLEVSHAALTPSVSRLISPAEVPYLQVLGSLGEPITQHDINCWASYVQLLNVYGPAECTVAAVCQSSLTLSSRPGDIGRPVGCVGWVIDPKDSERLVPIGALGELLIEGRIVGHGYLNNPAATQRAYIEPPRWLRALRNNDPNIRLYKTGDLVRYRPDGQMLFYGRKDTQVKIRGQRVELGEVEYQVHLCFEAAQDVAVDLVYNSQKETPDLCAFVCVGDGSSEYNDSTFLEPDDEFRAQAAETCIQLLDCLPTYMVPTLFIPLTTMPLSSSGKADRRSLREFVSRLSPGQMKQYRPIVQKGASQLSSQEETLLQGIWADILGLEKDRIHGNSHFFQVGGDSVNAMKVAAIARKKGLDISVADIFTTPKLTALAQAGSVREMNDFKAVPFSLCPVEDVKLWTAVLQARGTLPAGAEVTDIIPATSGQVFFLENPTLHHFTFQIDGQLDVPRLRDACEKVYHHFDILRTAFVQHNGKVLLVVFKNEHVPFRHIVTDEDPTELGERLRVADRLQPTLMDRPVFTFILLTTPHRNTAQIVFRMSHVQWDGLSLAELFVPLSEAYHHKPLTPVMQLSTVIYHRAAREKSKSLEFWSNYLQGSTITPLCQPIFPEAALDLSQGTTIWENVNLQPAPIAPKGITMASVVKAAWSLILARECGQNDLVFGHTVNGRSAALPDIETILGCCLNFIPMRIKLEPESWTVLDLLQHAQTQYQKTVAHDDIEIQTIVENCTPWAQGTDLNTIIQHQNIPLTHRVPLEGVETQFAFNGWFRPGRELFIFTEPHGDLLSVQFCVNPNMMSLARAKGLHKRLVQLIIDLCQHPGEKIAAFM